MSCNCCCEDFSKRNLRVACQFCDYEVCKQCQATYTFGTDKEIHCMSCKREWTEEAVFEKFPKSFVNKDLKIHRSNLLTSTEKMLLPTTQQHIPGYRQHVLNMAELDIATAETNKATAEIETVKWPNMPSFKGWKLLKEWEQRNPKASSEECISRKLNVSIAAREHQDKIDKAYEIYSQERAVLYKQTGYYAKARKMRNLKALVKQYRVTGPPATSSSSSTPAPVKWIWACPSDTCKGYMDGEHNCGTCEKSFCKECNEEITCPETHECNEDTKKSIKFMKRDSKPCPACHTVIHKISGCNQMWCPDCHTAFSWTTGSIETKIIHNPHYFQFLRENKGHVPRNPNDPLPGQCGADVNDYEILRAVRYLDPIRMNNKEYTAIYRTLGHSRMTWNRKYRNMDNPMNEDKAALYRILYIIGKIDEKTWADKLYRHDKACRKAKGIKAILDVFNQVGMDIIRGVNDTYYDGVTEEDGDFGVEDHQRKVVEDAVIKYKELVKFCQSSMDNIHKCYNCVVPQIASESSRSVLYM